jgi:hypothetical protein
MRASLLQSARGRLRCKIRHDNRQFTLLFGVIKTGFVLHVLHALSHRLFELDKPLAIVIGVV